MNIALTGSSGLIGSQLLKDLRNMGHQVLCISSSFSSHEENCYLYEELNSNNINFKADFMVHLASINSNLGELEMPLEIELMQKVIDSMKVLKCKNMIFFSSIKVYGDNSFESILIDENFPQNPQCFYGKAKVECEKVLREASIQQNFNYLILRLPPVLINHPKSNLGKLFQLVERGFPIPSFEVGDLNKRSFLNYDFLIYAMKKFLTKKEIFYSEVFNLADSNPISTNDLLRRFAKSINKQSRIIYLPNFLFQAMIRINRLQLILCRLFGNFYISNSKLREAFKLPKNF